MCLFITATMSGDGDETEISRVALDHQLKWIEIHNPSVAKMLVEGERYFFTTWSSCDCATSIGQEAEDESGLPEFAADLSKLRKKGWSEGKIQRWLEDKSRYKAKQDRVLKHQHDLERWQSFLSTVIHGKHAKQIGLLLHFYRYSYDDEKIEVKKRQRIKLVDLDVDILRKAERDVLYVFTG